MIKRAFFILLATLSLLSLCAYAAEEQANALLSLKDIRTNQEIGSVVATIQLCDSVITQFVEKGGILKIKVNEDNCAAVFKIDDLLTEGRDYYAKETLTINGTLIKAIPLYPVGSLSGMVKDRLDNLVANARLKFDCQSDFIGLPNKTDEFGSFRIDYLPVGRCRVFASHNNGMGFANLTIEKGSMNDIQIRLDKPFAPLSSLGWIIVLAGVIVLYAALRGRRIARKPESKASGIRLGKRAVDILETLPAKEREIIKFIVDVNGKTTQSKIYHGTGIPKVSLSRRIKCLGQKNIITIKRIGKVNNIELTEWFLAEQ